jgi:hypothetical protein
MSSLKELAQDVVDAVKESKPWISTDEVIPLVTRT